MTETIQVRVPDIGDFKDVDVIEVLAKPGDRINKEDSLITLESDKATMEVPSPYAGVVKELHVAIGDKVAEGVPILSMDVAQSSEGATTDQSKRPPQHRQTNSFTNDKITKGSVHTQVLVLGAGPGGYTAAFRAADLGQNVVLVDCFPNLGGVCLNIGCIPSKALLHAARVISDADALGASGVHFSTPQIDTKRLVQWWKNDVVKRLTDGLEALARKRKVTWLRGVGRFTSPNALWVETEDGAVSVTFDNAIIAAGSRPIRLPGIPKDDTRVLDSTSALDLPMVDGELLVVGGGIIGLEMATFYHAFGADVTLVELSDALLPGVDADLVRPLQRRIQKQYKGIYLNAKISQIEPRKDGLFISFSGDNAPQPKRFDQVLLAIGRQPNSDAIGIDNTGVQTNTQGFITVDRQQRTNVSHIFAIGDIVGQPMLAHKATHQGRVAAEATAGEKSFFDARVVPSVAYTDPEVAWAGMTENEARAQGIDYGKGVFPWAASGRSLSLGRDEGITKLLFDNETGRILGAGLSGPNAGELIAEAALAIEMGADAHDIALTIHPHPTLSETIGFAAEAFAGTITDLYVSKRRS